MNDRPVVATFDCYGALIDREGGLGNFLYAFALRNGEDPADNGDDMRRRWEVIQFELLQGPYRRYKEILASSLERWAGERGLPVP